MQEVVMVPNLAELQMRAKAVPWANQRRVELYATRLDAYVTAALSLNK